MQLRLKVTVIHISWAAYVKPIVCNEKDNFVPNVGDWAAVTFSIKRLNVPCSVSCVPKPCCLPPLHTYTWLLKRCFMHTIRHAVSDRIVCAPMGMWMRRKILYLLLFIFVWRFVFDILTVLRVRSVWWLFVCSCLISQWLNCTSAQSIYRMTGPQSSLNTSNRNPSLCRWPSLVLSTSTTMTIRSDLLCSRPQNLREEKELSKLHDVTGSVTMSWESLLISGDASGRFFVRSSIYGKPV